MLADWVHGLGQWRGSAHCRGPKVIDTLLRAADLAMYDAKAHGKDRINIAE